MPGHILLGMPGRIILEMEMAGFGEARVWDARQYLLMLWAVPVATIDHDQCFGQCWLRQLRFTDLFVNVQCWLRQLRFTDLFVNVGFDTRRLRVFLTAPATTTHNYHGFWQRQS